MSIDPYRLPKSVRPTDYRIAIQPDLEAETFSGSVIIDAVVEEAVESVVLNSDELRITSVTIAVGDGAPAPCEYSIDAEHERLSVDPPEALTPGGIQLEISFDGVFNDKLIGLYISRFTDDDGNEQKLATTQFEATAARKCFPCWDEPEFKARFALSLTVDSAFTAVANSPEIAKTEVDGGLVRFDFAPTMIMSTYLVAFVAGPLEITDPVDVDGVPLRIVHIPGKAHLTDFALEAGAFALRYFTEYFGLPYPDQKIDMVAIPDFAFGAMENLGCVTFREVLLLIDPDSATQPELQRAADVINHELAHMWFGDLVTMKWWNGLWLNEAFATFMEMRCTDAFRPSWHRWTDFGLSRTAAFDTDSLASTRPIEYEVVSPADADGMFDILTYEKGAAVVRMLEQYLGEDRFRAGIRRYMAKHQFGNAETTDLWDALEEETGEPVRRIMDSWIFQGGYPLVTLTAGRSGLSLSQSRMRYLGGDTAEDQTWAIPVQYRWKDPDSADPQSGRLLLDSSEPLSLDVGETPEWLLVNAAGASFLRTAYPDEMLEDLAELGQEQLSAVERYGLIDDAWASVLAGETTARAFLNLLEAMTAESDRSVWQRIITGFAQLKRLLSGEAEERLEEIAHDAIAPALAHLGLAPEPEDDDQIRQLRGDLVRALGTVANDPEIQEEAKRSISVARREPELLDAALLAASVGVVAACGDETDFNDFVDAWKTAETPQEEIRYLYALADFPDPDLVARIYTLILDGEIRSQNAPMLLGRALLNKHASRETWAFITENWDKLNELFADGLIVRMLSGLPTLNHASDQQSAAEFFATHDVPTGSQTLVQILENQRVQVALREREAQGLSQFLVL
ncbi:MAG: M1 family metallopeptidase [Acidimicrobiales bacterium]